MGSVKRNTYNGKNVIWESRSANLFIIAACFLFAALFYDADRGSQPFAFCYMISFLAGGIVLLIRFVNPQNTFVSRKSKLGRKLIAEQQELFDKDLGEFEYTEDAFIYFDGPQKVKWSEIKSIVVYRSEQKSQALTCMDITSIDNHTIYIDESIRGWRQFNNRLLQQYPSMDPNWETNLAYSDENVIIYPPKDY